MLTDKLNFLNYSIHKARTIPFDKQQAFLLHNSLNNWIHKFNILLNEWRRQQYTTMKRWRLDIYLLQLLFYFCMSSLLKTNVIEWKKNISYSLKNIQKIWYLLCLSTAKSHWNYTTVIMAHARWVSLASYSRHYGYILWNRWWYVVLILKARKQLTFIVRSIKYYDWWEGKKMSESLTRNEVEDLPSLPKSEREQTLDNFIVILWVPSSVMKCVRY